MLLRCLYVMSGGAVGSLLRYLVSIFVNERFTGRFPLATFLINITGSLVIGLFMGLGDTLNRPLLVTGLLGGFTTFSAFEWELFSTGRATPPLAIFYALSSVIAGWLACWLGATLARRA